MVGHIWSFGSGRLKLRCFPVFEISLYNIARLHLKPNHTTNNKQTSSYKNKNRGKEGVMPTYYGLGVSVKWVFIWICLSYHSGYRETWLLLPPVSRE